MWQRLTHAIRPKDANEGELTAAPQNSNSDVLAGVLEQHPNLSVFHGHSDLPRPSSSMGERDRPSSPFKSGRKLMKRLSKGPEDVLARAASPTPSSLGFPMAKKMKSSLSLKTTDLDQPNSRISGDTTRPSQDTVRTMASSIGGQSMRSNKRRTSLDMLRSLEPSLPKPPQQSRPSFDSLRNPPTPTAEPNLHFSSTRSILREPNTPGTGQNVRFFSRDAYKTISPNESGDALPNMLEGSVGRGSPLNPMGSGAVRISPTSLKQRPKLDDVFGHVRMNHSGSSNHTRSSSTASNPFDVSMDLPPIPPGLGFEINEPFLSADVVFQKSLEAASAPAPASPVMTSTPYRSEKGKARELPEIPPHVEKEIDDAIFHAQEPSLRALDESISHGATVFYSMGPTQDADRSSGTSSSFISSSSEARSVRETDSPSSVASRKSKSRGRALSDTVFQAMLRSKDSNTSANTSIESSALPPPVSPAKASAPPGSSVDPFSANANEYWTPASMNPATPPRTLHTRGNSKEENIILSLQTRLTLQTELCGQYETDLAAKDQMLSIMEKKLEAQNHDDAKRKSALKIWRKKVTELERAVRYLEDEVEHSRSESMERSIMDEASGEALRMLHRQIAGHEKEKGDWKRCEDELRAEIANLGSLLRERTDEARHLSQQVHKTYESETELRKGIEAAQAQIESLGNVSMALSETDHAELQRLLEKEISRASLTMPNAQQSAWAAEKAELETRNEGVLVEKARLEEELVSVQAQLDSPATTDKIAALEASNDTLQNDKDHLSRVVDELEQKVASLEIDWTNAENHIQDLETDVEDLWNLKEALEHEKAESLEHLSHAKEDVDGLRQHLQEKEAEINKLGHEKTYNTAAIARLEESIRALTADAKIASDRVRHTESEAEELREQLGAITRKHNQLVEDHARSLAAAASHDDEATVRLENLLKEKQEKAIEMESSQKQVSALTQEIERLHRQVQELQQQSADREVKLLQVTKQREKDREDMQGLNIALDAKQQELELIKRRMGVKGTAGATPVKPAAPKLVQRRDSSVMGTPTPRSRPSSIASDSGRESVMSLRDSFGSAKKPATPTALRTSRVSNAGLASSRSSMGPPPVKMSTNVAKAGLARSTSATATSTPTPAAHRRTSSVSTPSPTALDRLKTPTARPGLSGRTNADKAKADDKENVQSTAKRTALPA
ncbi:hypothetical protein DL96DRAFT_976113 [Flagelloscypha sp. PMI_526]|nr:hypothetical protein DL96DRAFT_976113 [Flagelloscypha sp. PMI_526]